MIHVWRLKPNCSKIYVKRSRGGSDYIKSLPYDDSATCWLNFTLPLEKMEELIWFQFYFILNILHTPVLGFGLGQSLFQMWLPYWMQAIDMALLVCHLIPTQVSGKMCWFLELDQALVRGRFLAVIQLIYVLTEAWKVNSKGVPQFHSSSSSLWICK